MEGGGGGGGYVYLQNNPALPSPPLYRSCPPLTAIERFLLSNKTTHFSHQQTQNSANFQNGFHGGFPSPSSGGAIGGFSWPSISPETGFSGGFFPDGERETLNWACDEINPNLVLNEENKSEMRSSDKGVVKKVKGGSSTNLIKGQWTDDEDRKLLKLVKQYGVRKWAQIAEKMTGRAGKQCRERWHNHLRPDIKKDIWSEEEEIMLVEAHKKVGNKWAEIAKRIPGRTENSIKNHWNATKRRQNSKRKMKKTETENGQNGKSQTSILQDYIKNLSENNYSTSPIITPTQSTTTPTGSTISDEYLSNQLGISLGELSESSIDDDSPQFMYHSYDDELNFMMNFFGNKNDTPSNDNNKGSTGEMVTKTVQNDQLLNLNDMVSGGFSSSNIQYHPKMLVNAPPKEEPPKTHLSSDLYLSYLLDGPVTSTSVSMDYYYGNQASCSSGKKDMDLMEMVATTTSTQFSLGANTNFVL